MSLNKSSAFSLLELLITLTLLVILLLATVPSVQHLVLENRATQIANRFIAAINYARSEAIQLHQIITFCSSSDHKTCGGTWRDGQIILTPNGRLLRVYEALAVGDHLRWDSSFNRDNFLRLSPSGFTYGQQGSFYYCPANKNLNYAWRIFVQQSGRMRVEQGSSEACSG
jgi:type IV fimbrial biogenesis protein FimT